MKQRLARYLYRNLARKLYREIAISGTKVVPKFGSIWNGICTERPLYVLTTQNNGANN